MKKILLGLLAFATLTATAADKKISDLTLLPAASFATGDLLSIVDVSASETKKTRILDLDTRYITNPFTTEGDQVYYHLGVPTRLAIGAANTVKVSDGTDPSWAKIADANIAAAAGITLSKLAALSTSRAAVTDGSGFISAATTTATEIGFVNGVTSSLCGISQACVQTNKTFTSPAINGANFNFGTASNTNRLLLPTDTTTNLAGYTNTAGLISYDSTQNKVVYNNGTAWTAVGSGTGGGGINWILNPNAETNTTGWNLYGVAGQNPPVDGTTTVGSVHVTWTRDLTSPLIVDSLGNFLFTKDAVNRQGEGASYDFTTDRSYSVAPGVHYIKFDYEAASGTFAPGSTSAEGDLTLWVYDKTNNILIQPFVYRIPSQNGHYITWFQNNFGSSSYRLIVHTASTSTSAFTMRFNRIKIEPAPASNALAPTTVIAANAFTPTSGSITASVFAAITGYSSATDTLGNAFNASTGVYTVQVPGWYTASAAVEIVGTGTAGAAEGIRLVVNGTAIAGNVPRIPTVNSAMAYSVSIAATYLNVGNTIVAQRYTDRTAATYTTASVASTFSVSRVAGSAGGPNSPITMKYTTTNSNNTTTGTAHVVTNWTQVYDSTGMFNATTGVATIQYPGKYKTTCNLVTASSALTVGSSKYMLIQITGTKSVNGNLQAVWASITTLFGLVATATEDYKAGDTISCTLNNATGATFALDNTANSNWITIERVGDASAADPATTTTGTWFSTNTTSLTTGVFSQVTYASTLKDSIAGMNLATGIWTAQTPGTYLACGNVFIVPSTATSALPDISLTIGSQSFFARSTSPAAGGIATVTRCATGPMTTGQTAYMQARCTWTGGTCSLNTALTSHDFSITRIGN